MSRPRLGVFALWLAGSTMLVGSIDLLGMSVPSNDLGRVPDDGGAVFPRHGDEAPQRYGIRFRCPSIALSEAQAIVENNLCPMYVIDPEDILTQPRLVVDPYYARVQAFHALHGGRGIHPPPPVGGPPPPDDHSRWDALHQPHTLFQTADGGSSWTDNRYYAPDPLQRDDRDVYGQENAVTVDSEGRIYLASGYAWRDDEDPAFHYGVTLFKGQRGTQKFSYKESFMIVPAADTFDQVEDVHITYSRAANRVVALWRQNATTFSNGHSGPASWVEAYVTVPGDGATWERLPQVQRIGPCRAISTPLVFQNLVYFGCLPDAASSNSTGNPDRWNIFSLEPTQMTTAFVATTPVNTAHGLLVSRGDTGYMIFIGSGTRPDGTPTVQVSYGVLGKNWQDTEEYGENLESPAVKAGQLLRDARVTAAAFAKENSYLHMIYLEHYETQATKLRESQARTLYKAYAVVRPTAGWQLKIDEGLHYGEAKTRANVAVTFQGGTGEDIFADRYDDIVVWRHPKTGNERIFVAFGDYGIVRYAEVLQDFPAPVIVLPPPSVAPIPLAVEAGNTATTAAAAGALFALMLLRMLAARRRTTVKVEA